MKKVIQYKNKNNKIKNKNRMENKMEKLTVKWNL